MSGMKVYPRVCGGTVLLRLQPFAGEGSIPACAGEPIWRDSTRYGHRVYPRVCGGTVSADARLPPRRGLSPRVRGNRQITPQRSTTVGSIPACAGEPGKRCGAARNSKVYPRVCGGTNYSQYTGYESGGLSPRVRGNRPIIPGTATTAGSIPACAGEPGHRTRATHRPRVYPRVCGGTLWLDRPAVSA